MALAGVSKRESLYRQIQKNGIEDVVLCLDNDEAGRGAAEEIKNELSEKGVRVKIELPVEKDWNEQLLAEKREREAKKKLR